MLSIAPHQMTLLQELQARLLEGAAYRIAILFDAEPPRIDSSAPLADSTPMINSEPVLLGESKKRIRVD